MENWEDWDNLGENNNSNKFPLQNDDGTRKVEKNAPSNTWSLSQQTLAAQQHFRSEAGLRAAHPYFESQPAVRILARRPIGPNKEGGKSDPSLSPPPSASQTQKGKSLEEREREYAEARKRILGETQNSPTSTVASPSATATVLEQPLQFYASKETSVQTKPTFSQEDFPELPTKVQTVARHPKGPTTSPSFTGRGRGKSVTDS